MSVDIEYGNVMLQAGVCEERFDGMTVKLILPMLICDPQGNYTNINDHRLALCWKTILDYLIRSNICTYIRVYNQNGMIQII